MIKKITTWCYMLNEEVMICPICKNPIICGDIGVNEDGYVYHWECAKNIDDIEMRRNKIGVILCKMDIPKNCTECPCLHHGEYGAFEKSWRESDSELQISENNRPIGCKIKPLDGLIEKIENINPTDYGSTFSYEAHNAVRDVRRDIVEIIKEYCEMED